MHHAKKDMLDDKIDEVKKKTELNKAQSERILQSRETLKQRASYIIAILGWISLALLFFISIVGLLALIYYYWKQRQEAAIAMTIFQCVTGVGSLIIGGIGLKLTFQSIKNSRPYSGNVHVVREFANPKTTGKKAHDEIVDF